MSSSSTTTSGDNNGNSNHNIDVNNDTNDIIQSLSKKTSSNQSHPHPNQSNVQLIALGFCGVDDSIHPHQLAMMCHAYPMVEFGVLLRPDLEGTARYASKPWLDQLGCTVRHYQQQSRTMGTTHMKLAAHLCGSYVNECCRCCISNDTTTTTIATTTQLLLEQIIEWGFQRVQINATAVNGVDTSLLTTSVDSWWQIVLNYPQLEFIFQKNQETEPLWKGIQKRLQQSLSSSVPITNVAMLVDESKGTGVAPTNGWPVPDGSYYTTGYAGGLGPHNISQQLPQIVQAVEMSFVPPIILANVQRKRFWIDMESSLRSIKNGNDSFDLDKCYAVIDQVCRLGLMDRPNYLPLE